MSRYIANSDISRINALSAGQSTRVSSETMECLEISRRMHALTGGAFDISIGTGLDRLDLDPGGFVVRARDEGVRLDLGGIGKGYAVDRVGELLEEWDLPKVLIHGGFSSVLAREPPPGREGWPLTLTAPGGGSRVRISVRQTALSASGTRKGAHIQDPVTGRVVQGGAAWAMLSRLPEGAVGPGEEWADAVRSPAAVAEALSTAFMLLPLNDIRALCARGPGLEAWVARGGPDAPLVRLGGADPR
jgi:thiamine biosynthesis lipoprotein